jgi:hypothetical protein
MRVHASQQSSRACNVRAEPLLPRHPTSVRIQGVLDYGTVNWFYEMLLATGLGCPPSRVLTAVSSDRQNPRPAECRVSSKNARQFATVHVREHEVDEYDGRPKALCDLQPGPRVDRKLNRMTHVAQQQGEGLSSIEVVLDHKHTVWRRVRQHGYSAPRSNW